MVVIAIGAIWALSRIEPEFTMAFDLEEKGNNCKSGLISFRGTLSIRLSQSADSLR